MQHLDCTCNQGRCACACGKGLCQKNSDGSDPHTEDDINPFAVQALALAVAAVAGVIFVCALAGYVGTKMGWLA